MDRQLLLQRVRGLRETGKSIRAIAAELGVHPSRVQRALKSPDRIPDIVSAPQSEQSRTLPGPATRVFVGRQREIKLLQEVLSQVISGQGRVVMLVGAPGIGKTRTAQEVAAHAQRLGVRVLWGWCYEDEGAPPYWPWVQPIRSYVQQTDPEQLRLQMGPGAANIAEIVLEVRQLLSDLEPPPTLGPEQSRFRLFDSVATFLRQAAQAQPLMLVLDDLHWADKSSLLLLQFLVRQLEGSRLMVVGCYRDVELSPQFPLAETLPQLSREPVFQREVLQGLSQEDTGRFIEVVVDNKPPQALVEAVHSRTEGNPFFTIEVVRLLSQRGALGEGDVGEIGNIGIPPGVSEVIGQRLNALSHRCRQTLNTASIIGREFDFRLLHTLSDRTTENQLLEVIDEALAAHLIEELPRRTEGYQFSHALVQQTLAEELSPSRRVRLHARIGTALESLCGTNVEAHAAELAYHFLEAEPVLGLAKLVSYSRLAGERALATYAHEEALAHFERALAAREGQAMDSETADLLSGLGHAQGATGQVREAWNTLSRAFDFYLEAGEVAKAVAVAEHPLLFVSGLPPGDTQLAERALTLVPPDSHEAGRLLSRHGLLLNLEQGDYAGAQKAFERALVIARRENDLALEMRTLANAADADWYQIHPQEVLQKSLRAIELAQRVQDPHTEIFSRFLAMYTSTAMGDLAGASEHCLNMLTQAERARDRGFLAMACLTNLFLCRHQGDWPAAREFSDRGLAAEPKATWLIGFRAVLEYQVGDFAQGETYLERLLEAMRATPPGPNPEYIAPACLLPMVDRITGIVDRLGIAKAAAVAALASPSTTPLYAMWARFGLALVAVQQGDLETASEQYNTLKPIVRGTMLPGLIGGDRLLGLLAQTMGNLNRAVDHFEEAGAFCRKASYHPELAWNCSDYAEALFQRNGPGDRAKASTLLEEALAISLKLGMGPLRERVINLQAIVESQSDTQPLYPDGLTRREVEVLRLIARGKSNREIAEELVLSVRTVERHIANIYGKTNAHGRVSATSYALQHDLASYK